MRHRLPSHARYQPATNNNDPTVEMWPANPAPGAVLQNSSLAYYILV